ncbi:MAG TPA: M6 family metalloprotease domain-containing protein [Candidatus Cloacimonadota bacterium]|nr:M6 family metalloprotease domain-containing protein [Candidatus Cloacimonadota bacterium]
MKRILIVMMCLLPLFSFAAYLENLPTDVTQPDGSVLHLLASGDEYANRLHDAAGYSIIQSPTDGYYYFAELVSGEPAASVWRADSTDPRALPIVPGINISAQAYKARKQAMNSHARSGERGPNSGVVNNLAVYIRFSDQTEFTDPRSVYDAKFNPVGENAYSLRSFFHKASYDQLDYVTYHYPVCAPEVNLSYQDSHPRAYYMPYNAITNPTGYQDWQRTEREHLLLANAIAAIASQVPAGLNIDADNDDYVDNVCFIIRGPHTAWAELLWAHRWALYTEEAYINGKMVWDFTFQPENHNNVRTLCHEMFHSAGAPDLYHYTFNGVTPAGCWDIMESGGGHMGMYMKLKYGEWIDPMPVITSGTYTLNPVTSPTNNAYRINLSGNEYLVLEYRKRGSDIFEDYLPGSGLLIYRINAGYDGNSDGPPDEVYIYRPNGSSTVNGLIADAAFSQQECRTEFNRFTNPACVLTSGGLGSVNIHSIGMAGDTITFTVSGAVNDVPPVITEISPNDGAIIVGTDQLASVTATAPNSSISSVQMILDGVTAGTVTSLPYSLTLDPGLLTPGNHHLIFTVTSANGMSTSSRSDFRVVDPSQQNWFHWLSDSPVWEEYGRGAIPIKVGVDMDLGTQQYVVKKIAFNLVPDPWGLPAVPGLINAKIYRFQNGAIQDQLLLDIGDIVSPMNGRYEHTVNSTIPISGEIVVVLDLYEYQNIVFDNNAVSGHSWFTEPSRPWTDALGRGILGSADVELLLQAPGSEVADPSLPVVTNLRNYPNPFNPETTLSFELSRPEKVSLNIYNLKGQLVRTLVSGAFGSGAHSLVWDGRDDRGIAVSGGMYLYQLQAGELCRTRKMVLLK